MLSNSFLVTRARIVEHGNVLCDAEIFVLDGRIAAVGKRGELHDLQRTLGHDMAAVDAQNHLVLPGLIDPHVHFRDSGVPNVGQRFKEDFGSGSQAAVAGGVTTVFDMPNTIPPTTTLAAFRTKRDHAAKTSYCDFGLYAGAAQDNVSAVSSIIQAGAVACKMYVGSSTGSLLVSDPDAQERHFCAASKHGYLLAIHAEHEGCLERHASLYEGKTGPHHHEVRPSECAEMAVSHALELATKHKTKTYVCHVSTAAETALIKEAKREGSGNASSSVFMEVTPHNLFLDAHEEDRQANKVRVNPPLRTQADQKALWQAVNDGTADTIGTDHAPHTMEEKRRPYWDAPSGVPGLETLLPLLVTAALEEKTTLEKVQQMCCHNPAQIFGLKAKGRLAAGFDADLVFLDLETEKPVDESKLFTRCGWSPFAGTRLRGWPVKTFLRGKLVFDEGLHFGPFGWEVSRP